MARLRVDMFEISRGCPEACRHCGFYEMFRPEDLRVSELSVDEIRSRVRRAVGFLNSQITTHVNTDPLRTRNFSAFARAVYEESGGESQVVGITHGVREGHRLMRVRLEEMVGLVHDRVMSLIVLTMDAQRGRGRISGPHNYASYRDSLDVLRGALRRGRVTVSIQGEREDGPYSIENVRRMFSALIADLAFTPEERARLVVDDRSYVRVGRSAANSLVSENCDVIPDPEFVMQHVRQDHSLRGLIDFAGRLLVQENRPGRTYNDSVTPSLWHEEPLPP